MFFPNRFQHKSKADDEEITEFHGPPVISNADKAQNKVDEEEKDGASGLLVPRERRYSAPPPMTCLLPISTPPERTLRRSFFQVFKPALDELQQPPPSSKPPSSSNTAGEGKKKDNTNNASEDRPLTPISMLMLKTEF